MEVKHFLTARIVLRSGEDLNFRAEYIHSKSTATALDILKVYYAGSAILAKELPFLFSLGI